MTRPAMTCPRCGAAMNHQADKLREPATREEAETSPLGGIVIVVFACPQCGWTRPGRATTTVLGHRERRPRPRGRALRAVRDQKDGAVACGVEHVRDERLRRVRSRCAVGSSRSSTGASATRARATTSRCRWPPESRPPSSPERVKPSGSDTTQSASRARRRASTSSSWSRSVGRA